MQNKFDQLWAASPGTLRRAILLADLVNGYSCGDLDIQLFNEQAYLLTAAHTEIANAIIGAGITPDENDLTQLDDAIQARVAAAVGGFSVGGKGVAGLLPAGFGSAISISAGSTNDSTGASFKKFPSTSALVVANGNALNGFQGGSSYPASSTIHVFAVWGTSAFGVYASTSITPSPLPTGCTFYRRIFSFRTDGSGNPLAYTALETAGGGLLCYLTTPVLDVNGLLIPFNARSLFATSVPAGVSMEWLGNGSTISQNNSNPNPAWAANLSGGLEPDVSVASTFSGSLSGVASGNPIPDTYASTGGGRPADFAKRRIFTDTSAQIGVRGSAATSSNMALYLSTYGWGDGRRA